MIFAGFFAHFRGLEPTKILKNQEMIKIFTEVLAFPEFLLDQRPISAGFLFENGLMAQFQRRSRPISVDVRYPTDIRPISLPPDRYPTDISPRKRNFQPISNRYPTDIGRFKEGYWFEKIFDKNLKILYLKI